MVMVSIEFKLKLEEQESRKYVRQSKSTKDYHRSGQAY